MTNASRIHDPHGSIMLRASFLRVEGMVGQTTQRAIGLGNKVLAGHPAPLPSGREDGWPIAGRGSGGHTSGRLGRDGSRGQLRRAHRSRMQSMSQAQTQVPDPLAEDLPELLPAGGMRTPSIASLLLIFIGQRRLKSPAPQVEIDDISGRESPG